MLDLVEVKLCYPNGMTIGPISLQVAPGTIIGLIGPNGAGKTSLLRAIAGLGNQTGKRSLNGEPLSGGVSQFLSFVEAEPVLAETMTVREFLAFDAAVRNLEYTKTDLELALERFGCDSFAEQKLSDCSLGMRKRAALSAAWLGNPGIILLDEPLNGLDTAGIFMLKTAIAETICHNQTFEPMQIAEETAPIIVVTSHILSFIKEICSRVLLLERGRISEEFSPTDNLEQIFYERFIKTSNV